MDLNLIPKSSFSILILFWILIHAPNSDCQDNRQFFTCGAPFQCSNIPNIDYPFWGDGRPDYCGHPQFRLSCRGDAPLIDITNVPYRILSIDVYEQRFTVARDDLPSDLCQRFLRNSTFDSGIFSYGSGEENLTILYGCTRLPGQMQPIHIQFDCPVNQTNSASYFMVRDSSGYNLSTVTCENRVLIPVNQTSVQALLNPAASVINLTEAISGGFELRWTANGRDCRRCQQSDGRCGRDTDTSSFACHCADRTYPLVCGKNETRNGPTNTARRVRRVAIGISVGALGTIIITLAIFSYFRRQSSSFRAMAHWKHKNTRDENVEDLIRSYGSLAPKRYNFQEIRKMTNLFSEKLGQGGFGSVFKGKLPDGRLVAVKILSKMKGKGEEFINEVASISRTSHVNVVTLLGFCYKGTKRVLIYEFMPNGSLDKFICNDGPQDKSPPLHWKTLYEISVGIARGLEYLHQGCNTWIVHFDIKPHNILLDQNFCPKIADFGLAKLCQRKESILSMLDARGTIGYIAPEVFLRILGGVSHKSDVYSYGMMVLEMAGTKDRINFGGGSTTTSEMYFPDWIYKYIEFGGNLRVEGVGIEEDQEETVKKMILVSLWCIQTNPSDRPSIRKALEMLEGSLQSLQIPPRPASF